MYLISIVENSPVSAAPRSRREAPMLPPGGGGVAVVKLSVS